MERTDAARRYIVSGLVQGVGFRYYALMRARERGVVGTVRNLPDGRVEVVAEGAADALDGLRGDLKVGPSQSRVTQVEERDSVPTGRYVAFTISR